jgi:acyl-CoA reductase-like NAD-dependent aldehyde dehydrogenase
MSLAPVKEKLKELVKLLPPDLASRLYKAFEKYEYVPATERERIDLMEEVVACATQAVGRAFKEGALTMEDATFIDLDLADLLVDHAEEWYHYRIVERLEKIVEGATEALRRSAKYVEWAVRQWEAVKEVSKPE